MKIINGGGYYGRLQLFYQPFLWFTTSLRSLCRLLPNNKSHRPIIDHHHLTGAHNTNVTPNSFCGTKESRPGRPVLNEPRKIHYLVIPCNLQWLFTRFSQKCEEDGVQVSERAEAACFSRSLHFQVPSTYLPMVLSDGDWSSGHLFWCSWLTGERADAVLRPLVNPTPKPAFVPVDMIYEPFIPFSFQVTSRPGDNC